MTLVAIAERLPHDTGLNGSGAPPDLWPSDIRFDVEGQLKADPLQIVDTSSALELSTQV